MLGDLLIHRDAQVPRGMAYVIPLEALEEDAKRAIRT
jgi:hypothetical protein